MTEHAHEARRCAVRDLFSFEKEPETDSAKAHIGEIGAYLEQFVAPIKVDGKIVCFHCGCEINAFKHMLGIGAAMEWGICHGEAVCSGMPHHDKPCGWPYRGMHYAKAADGSDLFTLRNFFLAYHPDEVTVRKEKVA